MDTYVFKLAAGNPGSIIISLPALAGLGQLLPGRVTLAHGLKRTPALVTVADSADHVLQMDERLAAKLGLVTGLPYRLTFSGGVLRIGPVIGILVAERTDMIDLTPGAPATHHLLRYADVGGLVYLFACDGVDAETIRGYRWLPGRPDAAPAWQADDPFFAGAREVAARMRRTAAAEGYRRPVHRLTARFEAMAGQFSTEAESSTPSGAQNKAEDADQGRFVKGVFALPSVICRRINSFPDSLKAARSSGVQVFNSDLRDDIEEYRYLTADLAIAPHLADGPVSLPRFCERANDYRVVMQKDDRGRWRVRACIGRFGEKGRSDARLAGDGYALPAHESIVRVLGVGDGQAHRLERELIDLAQLVCRAVDDSGGCFGELSVDVAIDRLQRLWLLAISKLPDPEPLLHIGDEQGYLEAVSGPLLFASHLAGFGRGA